MSVKRISVKLFVEEPGPPDLAVFIPIFQRWIQAQRVEGLLIDVADYKHVFQGPGVILIGHEGDYAVDNNRGQLGLLYTRKRDLKESLGDTLLELLRLVLAAGIHLQQEADLNGTFRLRTDVVEIAFLDRLQWPNQDEIPAPLKTEIQDVLAKVFPQQEFGLASVFDDPRQPLTIRVEAAGAPDLDTLLARVNESAAPVA